MIKKHLHTFFFFLLITTIGYGQLYHNEWIDYSKTYYKFKVGAFGTDAVGSPVPNGIVRIPYTTIQAAGLASVPAEQFQLWRDGEEVPVYVSKNSGMLGASDYIEFWGEINNGNLDKELYRNQDFQLNEKWSLQTDTAAYFLTINTTGNNKRLQPAANNVATNNLGVTPYFMSTVGRYYRNELLNGFSAVSGHNLYSSSYDRGEGFVSRAVKPVGSPCGGATTLPQGFSNLNAYQQGPNMQLKINAVGDAPNSRNIRFYVNNDSIASYQLDYFYDGKFEESVPVSKVINDGVTIYVVNQSTQGCDEFRVAKIELTYPRTFNMPGISNMEMIVEKSAVGRYIEFTNFAFGHTLPVIYDLANGKRYEGDTTIKGKVRLALPPSSVPYRLVLTTQSGTYYKTIGQLQERKFVDFTNAANQGDYLIISNPLIYGNGANNYVEQYRQYRTSDAGGKYVTQVIDVNELVDQFAWGVKKHPLSIKNFLRYARQKFAMAPKIAFLIGKAVSYNEYRMNEGNPMAERLNLVPTFGYPASDNLLSSDDINAIPATPIGRLSAVTPEEVRDYLQKVKEYDSAQYNSPNTIAAKGWMKNVLQIAGANDLQLGAELDGYLRNYKKIIGDTSFGANVTNFSKTADPAHYTDAVVSFKNIYEHGSSLITYFGHSSSTSLDFNLDNPEFYDNRQKYPVFIANGCTAGNHFGFETSRFNNKSTISEKFVLANESGAIGYLASSHYGIPNYLDLFTTQFYKAFSSSKFNQPIGEAIKEGISKSLQIKGFDDYYARLHAEEFAYHGDPAIRLNPFTAPDYVIEEPQIETSPSFVSVADTSFNVKVRIYNIGKATIDSVDFKLDRILPSGKLVNVMKRRLKAVYNVDSITATVGIIGNRDKGINKFVATVAASNQAGEVVVSNNTATKSMVISEDEIRPIYPYKNAIVNVRDFKFQASTVNPLSAFRAYVMQIDTTDLFNSATLAIDTVSSTGGVISFSPVINLQNNTVYYWRVAPVADTPHWYRSSFKFDENSFAGFEQSHFYQHTKANLERVTLDSATRRFKFKPIANNLFIVNSIYPTSGTEDNHFSVAVNGVQIIASACDGPALQFNVFDPISFKPWVNPPASTGLYGSISTSCGPTRLYNFDFLTTDSASRRKARNFMDIIPDGYFVVVRTVASSDDNVNAYVNKWMADTAVYGSGNTVYHRLKNAGFATIDSFYRARTFSFVYKKNDSTFAPQYVFSDGVYDRINLNVNCTTPDTLGYISSIPYGPAKGWKRVKWAGRADDTTDVADLQVIGTKSNGSQSVLFDLPAADTTFDISAVSATEYPFIELRLKTQDSISATPYQLSFYQVEYDAAPEGGIAPNLYFNTPDTVGGVGSLHSDTLHVGVAYKNASKVDFDSLSAKIVLYDSLDNATTYILPQMRRVPAGDTVHIDASIPVNSISGLYNVMVVVNPKPSQLEQESFNNFLYKYVYITHPSTLPVGITFNAEVQANDVRTSWKVEGVKDVVNYNVEHSVDGLMFSVIGRVAATNQSTYSFIHKNVPEGRNYYRLKITARDGAVTYSATKLVTITKGATVNIYPNPVKDKFVLMYNNSNGKTGTVTLINAFGQRLMQKSITGTTVFDVSNFAAGTYIVQVDDGNKVKTYKVQKQ